MKAQVKTLMLMVVVMATVIIYALNPNVLTIGKIKLKKYILPSFSQNLNIRKVENKQQKRKLARNQIVLFIGDSMVEGLSRRLADYAAENGHKLYSVIWYSSSTEKWATSNTIEYYRKEYNPTYVIICLGSNELFVNDLSKREEYIRVIQSKIDPIPFVWISPCDWNGDTGINELIKKVVGKGHFFDSRNLKLERGSDHYHPTWSAAAYWLDSVVRYITSRNCDVPIVLNKPKGQHKATRLTILKPSFEGY